MHFCISPTLISAKLRKTKYVTVLNIALNGSFYDVKTFSIYQLGPKMITKIGWNQLQFCRLLQANRSYFVLCRQLLVSKLLLLRFVPCTQILVLTFTRKFQNIFRILSLNFSFYFQCLINMPPSYIKFCWTILFNENSAFNVVMTFLSNWVWS